MKRKSHHSSDGIAARLAYNNTVDNSFCPIFNSHRLELSELYTCISLLEGNRALS